MSHHLVRSSIILAGTFWIAASAPAQTVAAANIAPIRYGFTADWSRERMSVKNKAALKDSDGSTIEAVTTNTFVGHVKVTNRSSAPLQNLEVHIQMHYKVVEGKVQRDEHKDSVKTIPSIKQNETVTVDTDPLVLKVTELKGGYYHLDGSPTRQSDSIRGGIITLHHGGIQVFEYVSNPALKSLAGAKSSGTTPK